MRTFQLTATFDNLSVVDNLVLAFFRAHRKSSLLQLLLNTCKGQRNDPKIVESLETFDLQDVRDRQVKNLSLGEKRRLEIAMAILAEPKVLLLDEPLAGLSESEIKGVLNVLRQRIGRQTILIVEHKISHVQDFLQRLTVMHEGRIIADGGYEECCAIRKCAEAIGRSTLPANRTGPSLHDEQRRYPDGCRAERRLRRIEGAVRRRHERAARARSLLASAATAPARPRCSRASPDSSSLRRERSSPNGDESGRHGRLRRSPEWESNTSRRTRRSFPI